MHVILWYRKDIAAAWKNLRRKRTTAADIEDPHYEKMKRYRTVPQWVYGVVFIGEYELCSLISHSLVHAVSLGTCIGTSYFGGKTTIPWWSIILFTAFGYFFAVILGFLQAITGFQTSINGIIQIIAAFVHPGR